MTTLITAAKETSSYSACVVYTKTIIHLSVGESDGYLPRALRLGKYSSLFTSTSGSSC